MIAWRVTKTRFDPWDGTGASLRGGRWNSPGHPVLYAADSFAGALLEILAHMEQPETLPGEHHAIRIDIDDALVEPAAEADLSGWERQANGVARGYGDAWLAQARSAALLVPALPRRPIGRLVVINPLHPDAARITRGAPFRVPWDERLF